MELLKTNYFTSMYFIDIIKILWFWWDLFLMKNLFSRFDWRSVWCVCFVQFGYVYFKYLVINVRQSSVYNYTIISEIRIFLWNHRCIQICHVLVIILFNVTMNQANVKKKHGVYWDNFFLSSVFENKKLNCILYEVWVQSVPVIFMLM